MLTKNLSGQEYIYKSITGIITLLIQISTLQYKIHVLQITFKLQLLKCNHTRIGIHHVLQNTCTIKPLD